MFARAPLFVVLLAAGCAAHGPPTPEPKQATRRAHTTATALEPATVDARLAEAWRARGVRPAPLADDATFIRRAYLDLAGRIPPPEAVTAYRTDRGADKRGRLVDALLDGPLYAAHFTNYWERAMLGRATRGKADRVSFRAFLRDHLQRNTPYDQLVRAIVTANGANAAASDAAVSAGAPPVNGATNWYLRYADDPSDLAGATSRLFLGVQLQCAQCHDHKTEAWKVQDFRNFAAVFDRTRVRALPALGATDAKGERRGFEVHEQERPTKRAKRTKEEGHHDAVPTALDGTDLSGGPSPRENLAAWMTGAGNPWFSRALVDRAWALLLGSGFTEPIDDARDSNPPRLPELQRELAADFVAHGYDLKHLLRLVAKSDVYARAATPSSGRDDDDWAHFRLKRLGPDELLDSLLQATRLPHAVPRLTAPQEPDDDVERVREGLRKQFSFLFDVDEDTDHEGEFDGTIGQALATMNGKAFSRGSRALPGTALAELLARTTDDAERVRALFLRVLSRPPSSAELDRAVAAVQADEAAARSPRAKVKAKTAGYEDLLWALLNTSEFAFNH